MFAILSFMILNHNKIIIKQNYTSSDKKGNKTDPCGCIISYTEADDIRNGIPEL